MKFIIVERKVNADTIQLIPFIFSKDIVHITMYDQAKVAIKNDYGVSLVKCVSAGEVNIGFGGMVFSGESTSLKISCHKNTTEVMKTIEYFNIFMKENNPLK